MKVLPCTDKDISNCGDWLVGEAVDRFILGRYTHIRDNEGSLCECEGTIFQDGTKGVMIGEQVRAPEASTF